MSKPKVATKQVKSQSSLVSPLEIGPGHTCLWGRAQGQQVLCGQRLEGQVGHHAGEAGHLQGHLCCCRRLFPSCGAGAGTMGFVSYRTKYPPTDNPEELFLSCLIKDNCCSQGSFFPQQDLHTALGVEQGWSPHGVGVGGLGLPLIGSRSGRRDNRPPFLAPGRLTVLPVAFLSTFPHQELQHKCSDSHLETRFPRTSYSITDGLPSPKLHPRHGLAPGCPRNQCNWVCWPETGCRSHIHHWEDGSHSHCSQALRVPSVVFSALQNLTSIPLALPSLNWGHTHTHTHTHTPAQPPVRSPGAVQTQPM